MEEIKKEMSLLFKIISLILILLVFIITVTACLYVLAVEIDWILEVDVLWKVKQKVRVLVYGNQLGIYRSDGSRRSNSDRTGDYRIGALKRFNKQHTICATQKKTLRKDR